VNWNGNCGDHLGGAARVSPGAPGGRERFGDVVREILEAGSRSTNDLFEEFKHGDRNRQ